MENLLALFPLHTVLFPGVVLPLQIFEPRYKLMISRCLELRLPFGVVLIRDGVEVGGPAEPYDVGTTAAIQTVLRLEDGMLLLSAVGERRFRIEQIVQREPYLVAQVTYLEDTVTPEAATIAAEIRNLYRRHSDALAHATGIETLMDDLPDDPLALHQAVSLGQAVGAERELGRAVGRLARSLAAARAARAPAAAGPVLALMEPAAVAGILLLTGWMLLRLRLLQIADLSFVLPVTAVGYILNAALGAAFLGEQVSLARWAGAALITGGAALTSLTPAGGAPPPGRGADAARREEEAS